MQIYRYGSISEITCESFVHFLLGVCTVGPCGQQTIRCADLTCLNQEVQHVQTNGDMPH